MRVHRPAMIAVLSPLLFPLALHADPADPTLKFWVQLPGYVPDPGMLHDLVMGDTRIEPILRVNLNNDFQLCPRNAGVAQFSAEAAADEVFCQLSSLTHNFDPVFLSGTFDPAFPHHNIGIQLAGFGIGGRPADAPFWVGAPALAFPPGRTPLDPNLVTGTDFLLDNVAPGLRPLTPWYDNGAKDCAVWLNRFADRYTSLVRAAAPPTVPAEWFQPKRLIFDIEIPLFPTCLGSNGVSDTQAILNSTLGGGTFPADPRNDTLPVLGFLDPSHGAFDPSFGRTLRDLRENVSFPCDSCSGDQCLLDRLWLANVNTQAHVAALDRAVKVSPGGAFLPARHSFFYPDNDLLYTNFLISESNGLIEQERPPYDIKGHPLRKVAYTQGALYTTYHSYPELSAPGSYGCPHAVISSGTLGRYNQTPSDWVVQSARETFETVLFSHMAPGGGGLARPFRPYTITPWIAGVNQYFVNMDHHRKLLALARAKRCGEFNVFIGTDTAMPARNMANWMALRHVIDQVWGFDVNVNESNAAGLVGVLVGGLYGDLEFGDFKFLEVESVLSSNPGAPFTVWSAAISPVFDVARPYGIGSNTDVRASDIATSGNLRVNIEFTAKLNGVAQGGLGSDDPVAPAAYIWHPGKGVWVPLPMTPVCAANGMSPLFGERFTLTGMVANAGKFVTFSTLPSGPVGQVKLLIGLSGNARFTAHFDLVQVVGVDKHDSDVDWNHDGLENINDVLAFVDDFAHLWGISNRTRIDARGELSALDANGDGWIDTSDLCAFESGMAQAGRLTAQDVQTFRQQMLQRFPELGGTPCGIPGP